MISVSRKECGNQRDLRDFGAEDDEGGHANARYIFLMTFSISTLLRGSALVGSNSIPGGFGTKGMSRSLPMVMVPGSPSGESKLAPPQIVKLLVLFVRRSAGKLS
jgi:hypothetical protein